MANVTFHEFRRAGKTHHWIDFRGHAGSIKEAARRTPGVSFMSGRWGNGQAGASNNYELEFAQPSQELYEAFLTNYRTVCQEKATRKKKSQQPLTVHSTFQATMDQLLIPHEV